MTQKRQYKTGDIVKLKSGGPDMTVKDYDYLGKDIICQWFAGSKLNTGHFDPESVEPSEKLEED